MSLHLCWHTGLPVWCKHHRSARLHAKGSGWGKCGAISLVHVRSLMCSLINQSRSTVMIYLLACFPVLRLQGDVEVFFRETSTLLCLPDAVSFVSCRCSTACSTESWMWRCCQTALWLITRQQTICAAAPLPSCALSTPLLSVMSLSASHWSSPT